MTGSTLTIDAEIRYIIQWFNEWSEMQREDFVPVFVEYLKTDEGYVNGLVAGLNNASCVDKPLSLFQCRVKLFREWAQKWPEATKERLKEKLRELDGEIMQKIEEELQAMENGVGDEAVAENGDVAAVADQDEDNNSTQSSLSNGPQSLVTNSLPDEIATA